MPKPPRPFAEWTVNRKPRIRIPLDDYEHGIVRRAAAVVGLKQTEFCRSTVLERAHALAGDSAQHPRTLPPPPYPARHGTIAAPRVAPPEPPAPPAPPEPAAPPDLAELDPRLARKIRRREERLKALAALRAGHTRPASPPAQPRARAAYRDGYGDSDGLDEPPGAAASIPGLGGVRFD